jgi:hypothetical protein
MNQKQIADSSAQNDSKPCVSGSFSTVILMVEDGWNISTALEKLGISRAKFYKEISVEQKCLLDMVKTANTKYGVGSKRYKNNLKTKFN